jgi:hypothetical protein
MTRPRGWLQLSILPLILFVSCKSSKERFIIVHPENAAPLERLAAKEVRRYLYVRTGRLVAVEPREDLTRLAKETILICQKDRFLAENSAAEELKQKVAGLGEQEYLLETFSQKGKRVLLVAGGDGPGTLYGAYRLAEKLGVRFYLHGDVVPDGRISLELPVVDEKGRPLFRLRGIHPFHDFPEGPDWWNADDYKAVLAQLPKLRMNFFGLHTYPEGHPNAEPTVWIGLPQDSDADGSVRFSYPSSYQNTLRGNWGYEPTKTGDYYFGAARLFESDGFGAEVMSGMIPEPKTLEDSNALSNRTGTMLKEAFTLARALGVKTCIGTEMPLTVPEQVKKRLRELGQDPSSPGAVKELYRGIFTRIRNTHPLDYYWLWTDENWTWSDASEAQVKAVVDDARAAIEAAREIQAPFSLATCGWVLGPPSDRTLFDRVLPKEAAVSCINREVGKAPVDPMFARIRGRSKWAIPWLEDDPALTSPQLWVGRMRRDAADALAYGCDGLLGIHWRTRILSPNVSALAAAAWDQTAWTESPSTSLSEGPVKGIYISLPGAAISGTAEEPIYRDIRDRVYGYHLAVPNGTYTVILKFCELELKEKGRRVFDISLQGKKVLEKLDIFARSGFRRALDLRFGDVIVENGRLEVDFADRIHYPSIAGLVIQDQGYSRKINCGGPAYQDYEPDWPETPRYTPVLDFYEDWAVHQFGPEAGRDIARIFARIDGRLPQPNIWTGPGGIKPDPRPWEEVKKEYEFVSEFVSLQPWIAGRGNQERFAYWVDTFLYMEEIARVECLWAEYDKALEMLKKRHDNPSRAEFAARTLLPIRERMVDVLESLHRHLLATVSNTGELGTVANWQQHLLPALMLRPGAALEKILGQELPASAQLPRTYGGPPRIIVPTVRTLVTAEEPLRLKVIILARETPSEAVLYWRELGRGDYSARPLNHRARGVFEADCPGGKGDFEYYIRARVGKEEVTYPPTAPLLNLTVVRME